MKAVYLILTILLLSFNGSCKNQIEFREEKKSGLIIAYIKPKIIYENPAYYDRISLDIPKFKKIISSIFSNERKNEIKYKTLSFGFKISPTGIVNKVEIIMYTRDGNYLTESECESLIEELSGKVLFSAPSKYGATDDVTVFWNIRQLGIVF